ncbi:MAG: MerR family transcriptional regulator [Bacteroidota bacterium]
MYANTTSALMRQTGQRLYTIGEAADLIGVSVPTIRMYEREGLIIPQRKASRHRLFAEHDLQRIRCIRKTINAEKVSIAGIRRMMALIPCWKMKGCSEEERNQCAAYRDHDAPCWMVTEKSWSCKSTECRTCRVYIETSDCSQLKQILQQYSIPVETQGPPAS